MRLPLIAAACVFLRYASAIFADEAWSVDYHHALLGEPLEATTFFHQPDPNAKAALIYTLSERGVLGAVNPRDGQLVWRHLLSHDAASTNTTFLRAGHSQDTVVSGIGSEVAAWSAGDGKLVWSKGVRESVKDIEILELPDGKSVAGSKDVLVLSGGERPVVQRLDGVTGAVKWTYTIESGGIPYQLSASTTEVFAITLHKTVLGYIRIKVLSLDPVNGHRTDEISLTSDNEVATPDTIIVVGANSASPIIAWTDATHSVLKVNIIGTKSISTFYSDKDDDRSVKRIRIHAPYHTTSLSHFLVHFETESSHWADVFHVDLKKNKIEKAYSLPKVEGKGTFATTTIDANVYFTRITSNEVMTVSSASHGVLGRWPIEGFGIAAGAGELVEPLQAVSELSMKAEKVSAIRTAVVLSTGDWVLLRAGTPVWQRPEALAGTLSATFSAPLPVKDLTYELEIEAHSNPVQAFIHRLKRHIEDLQLLPKVLSSLPQRFISGFLGTSADGGMAHDTFGFHQVVACVTQNGRLIALDAGNANSILWSRPVEADTHEDWQPRLETGEPGILILQSGSKSKVHHFNASTGERLSEGDLAAGAVGNATHSASKSTVQYSVRRGEIEAERSNVELWHFKLAEGERIIDVVPRPADDPVASIGKVLGDRRVLYKYLDPNLALVATARDATRTASFYVLDTVSGSILHSNSHTGIDLQDPISLTMSENWFAYSYTAEASDSSPKGHQLVVAEMFESLVPNDRGPFTSSKNFSTINSKTEPFTLVQTYQIPEAILKMAVTRTRQGITSRQLLAVLADSQAIVGIPYGVLDPRRPAHRDPTKDEQMEGLVRYSPVIEFDPKWYLTHQREVLGIDDLVTSPASLESTSLVFAYGLDIFGTRLSPSFSFDVLGKDFNKFQMLATVAALAVATFVVAPLVMRKQVNTRWQFT